MPLLWVVEVQLSPDPGARSELPGLDWPVAGRRPFAVLGQPVRGTTYLAYQPRSMANSPEATGMGFWSLNPYVGCEFGCSYCYARFTHRYVEERARTREGLEPMEPSAGGGGAWEAFERRIFVKQRDAVLVALARDLVRMHRARRAGRAEPLVIGTATDPYQPAERVHLITRSVLERLACERGLALGIITKSPLICRDIPLLREIQQRNRLSIHISLISTDARLIRALEARTPTPRVRLKALGRLTGAGLNAGLIVAPVLPGVTDTRSRLLALLSAARDAGARFAHPSPLRLYPAIRERFTAVLDSRFPGLGRRYRAAYQGMGGAPVEYARALTARFRQIAAQVGLSTHDQTADAMEGGPPPSTPDQLALWSPPNG